MSDVTVTIAPTPIALLRNVPSLDVALTTEGAAADLVRALLGSSHDCIKYVELDGSLSIMNANGMCAMQIDDFADVAGRPWASLWPPESAGLVEDALAAAIGGRSSRFEAYCPTAKGTPRWWDVAVAPVTGHDGQPVGVVSISRDVTSAVEDRRRIEDAARHAEALSQEIAHRVKNLFALVPALIALSSRNETDVRRLVQSLTGRIQALSRSHTLTLGEQGRGASPQNGDILLEQLVAVVLEPYRVEADAFTATGPAVRLTARHADTLALMLHELATNAAKYGSLSVPEGRVAVRWDVGEEGALRFEWVESGGPAVSPPTASGFGTRLIDRMVAMQGGVIVREWRESGARLSLDLPVVTAGQGDCGEDGTA